MSEAREAPPRRRGFFALLPLLIFSALAAVFFLQLWSGGSSTLPSAMIGKPAPEIELAALPGLKAGGTDVPGISSAGLRGGKPTLVNVFASWCVPCRDEHPLLMELARDPRIRIFGVNYKDQPGNALRFLGALGNPYSAVGVVPIGGTWIDWGVYGVPETFLVKPDGTIAFKLVGPISPENFRAVLLPEIEKLAGK